MESFKVGDLVRLKSGGVRMSVVALAGDHVDLGTVIAPGWVALTWCEEGLRTKDGIMPCEILAAAPVQ